MNIKCRNEDCKLNKNNKCTADSKDELICDRDIFRCKVCGHKEMMEDPLETERCPYWKCRVKMWDVGEIECFHCGHKWVPKTYMPTNCPNCSRKLDTI